MKIVELPWDWWGIVIAEADISNSIMKSCFIRKILVESEAALCFSSEW